MISSQETRLTAGHPGELGRFAISLEVLIDASYWGGFLINDEPISATIHIKITERQLTAGYQRGNTGMCWQL